MWDKNSDLAKLFLIKEKKNLEKNMSSNKTTTTQKSRISIKTNLKINPNMYNPRTELKI